MDLNPSPLQEDALLALQAKTNAALQASARQKRLAAVAAANRGVGDSYVYSYYRDNLFPPPKAVHSFKQNTFWDKSPSFSRLASMPDKEHVLEPKVIRSVLSRTLPTPFHDRFGKNWMDGSVEEFSAIIRDILQDPTLCNTPELQSVRNCFISLAKTPPDTFSEDEFGSDYRPVYGDLPAGSEANAWTAANKILD